MAAVEVEWPLSPMLARLERALPVGAFTYEPKWDGFRCLARHDGVTIDLRSRTGRPLARYFPEVVEALRQVASAPPWIVDGELLVVARDGASDFAALMARLHPAASRVELLRTATPATFVAFDVVAARGEALLTTPFSARRDVLTGMLAPSPHGVVLTPATRDVADADAWLRAPSGAGIDGVVAKAVGGAYTPGKRTMVKVKRVRTADCVVAGFRVLAADRQVASLLLGLFDGDVLRHVGVVASFTRERRRALVDELAASAVPLDRHPWRHGYALEGGPMGRLRGSAGRWTPDMGLDWVPVRPERVAEVAYDQVDGIRFRHPARFVRWRPDRDAASCTVEQLRELPGGVP